MNEVLELMTCARLVLDDYRNAIECMNYADEAAESRELADQLEAAITALEGDS